MQNLKRVIECREGRRCNSPLVCKTCGESWKKGMFKSFCNCLSSVVEDNSILTYLVIKPNELLTLGDGIKSMMLFMDSLRELKKRNKLSTSFSRLEVSFGKKSLGYNPHLNMLVWGDTKAIINIALEHGLKPWHKRKENTVDTAKSIAWYMLKFNSIGIEKGEAVRVALNRRTQLLHTREFNHKKISYIDEFIDIDFSFMGTYPIRSKEEIKIRDYIKEERKKLNDKLKYVILNKGY